MRNPRILVAGIASAVAITVALAGCGTTEEPADSSSSGGDPVTITDSRGVEVTLDGPAARVVGTEWNVIENLVTLGIMPVGAADVSNYGLYVSAGEPLDETVTDIGTRGEPSIDTIATLDADLIIATNDLSDDAIAQLEDLAPVIVVASADASRQIDQMKDNFTLIAEATGTETEAAAVLDAFDATVIDGAAAIEAAGLTGSRVAFADGYVYEGVVTIRPYVDGSLIADVNTAIGLVSPWTVEGDAAYGLAATDVEGLTTLDTDSFVYGAGADLEAALEANAVWGSLPFVQSGEVYRTAEPIWSFGGPASMIQQIDVMVATLTA